MLEDCKKEFDEIHKDMEWSGKQFRLLEKALILAVVVILALLMYIASIGGL